MESLNWVDKTYMAKHKSDDPSKLRAMYYPNLRLYEGEGRPSLPVNKKAGAKQGIRYFLFRSARKAGIAISIYLLSFVPLVGKLVLPAVSFYTFNNTVGPGPAVAIFASGLVLPKKYLVVFLQTFYSSRSMMRELVTIRFCEVQFDIAYEMLARTLLQPHPVLQDAKSSLVRRS